MTDNGLWPLIQTTAFLWAILAACFALWPLDWALRHLRDRRHRHLRREARLALAERHWRAGRMVWLSPDADRLREITMDVLPWCVEPRERERGTEIPVAFRRAFGGDQ